MGFVAAGSCIIARISALLLIAALFLLPGCFVGTDCVAADVSCNPSWLLLRRSGMDIAIASLACPSGYVKVPPNSAVGTVTEFCAAKYEMKCAADPTGVACSGQPLSQTANLAWQATQATTRTVCSSLGSGYHLITNPEWMTLARNIETTTYNWSGGVLYSGSLNQGHGDGTPAGSLPASTDDDACSGTGQTCSDILWDSQRRIHRLSNGEVIWDLAGNRREYVDWNVLNGRPSSGTFAYIGINSQTPTAAMPAGSFQPANAALAGGNGIGSYYPGADGSGGAARRGGRNGAAAGIFTADMDQPASGLEAFRCTYQ